MKQLPNISNNRKGFTLIELLVVIAIIAILATIGAAIFSGVQSRARDGRRQADVLAIAKALEAQKASTVTTYPRPFNITWFAGGVIPTDPRTTAADPKYVIVSSSTIVVSGPDCGANDWTWAQTGATTPTIPAACMASASIANEVISSSTPAAAFSSFQVCALLESSTLTNPNNIFCVPNQQ